jgi:nucleoside-diphosphate-sugar epimerase
VFGEGSQTRSSCYVDDLIRGLVPIDAPKVRQPDITRAKQLLGWEPEIDVGEGLPRTIEHYTGVLSRVGSAD